MKQIIILFVGIFGHFLSSSTQAQSEVSTADQYVMLGSYERAVEMYQVALNSSPSDYRTMGKLVTVYQKLGKVDEIYSLLSVQNPSNLPAQSVLSQAHACKMLGKMDEAKYWYKAYREHDHFVAQHYYQSCDFAQSEMQRPGLYHVDLLNNNSSQSDYGPAYFQGQLVFASHRTDMKRSTKKSEQLGKSQLFKSDIVSRQEMANTVFLRDDLQDVFGEGPVSYSEDGRFAAVMRSESKSKGYSMTDENDQSLSIYLAITDVDGNWTLAEPFPYNSTSYSNAWPQLRNGGKTMYFASNRPDGYGGYDIYVSHRKKGEWSIPVNLGAHVNTQGNEITPHFSNGNLFFASDWHFGFGGYDIFRAEIRNGDYARIYHLGKDINSSYNDYGLVTQSDAKFGYFTSNRPSGTGAEDIYFCSKISGQVEIVILDAHNNKPISGAEVKMKDEKALLYTDRSGKCSVNLPGDHAFSFEVLMEGYNNKEFSVVSDPNSINSKNYKVDLEPRSVQAIHKTASVIDSKEVIYSASHKLVQLSDTETGSAEVAVINTAPVDRVDAQPSVIRNSLNQPVLHSTNSMVTQDHKERKVNVVTPYRVSTTATTSNGTPLRRPVTQIKTKSNLANQKEVVQMSSTETVAISSTEEQSASMLKKFAIQLASFHEVHTHNVDMNPFKRLFDLGGLYKSSQGGITKVRLGTFDKENDARHVLNQVKLRGFKDAFIVHENDMMPFDAKPKAADPTINPSQANPKMSAKPASGLYSLTDGYKVRLAAYSDASNFDHNLIRDLGYAEMVEKSPFTIIYLSGLIDYNAAKLALNKMQTRGFKDAYVILNKDGIQNKIQ